MDGHLADLRLAFGRLHWYELKMNQLKHALGVSVGKFLGFIINEHGIEIDPTKIESINKVQPPHCKNNMQKFLGKVNYLRLFISNLSGKIISNSSCKTKLSSLVGQIGNALLKISKDTCLRRQ
jgi:hypothetical protein